MVETTTKPKSRRTGWNWLRKQKRLGVKEIITIDGKPHVKPPKLPPNKLRRTAPRKNQWKCVCGCWNVNELALCEHCGRNTDGELVEKVEPNP